MSNMVVRTNIYALNSHRNMKNVGLQQKQASNRLSSGYRINSAADDAAGLAISETMRAQIRGLDQASRNAQDGQAMILTTEGGLEEIGNIMQRVRELLVQASNDTNNQSQRNMIEQEVAQLGKEILSMQERVEFNTNKVLAMGNIGEFSDAWQDFSGGVEDLGTARSDYNDALEDYNDAKIEFEEAQKAWDTAKATNAVTDDADELADAASEYADAWSDWADAQSDFKDATDDWTSEVETWADTFKDARAAIDENYAAESSGNYVAWFQVGANSNQGIQFDFETVNRVVGTSGQLVTMIADGMVTLGTLKDSGIGYGESMTGMIADIQKGLDELNKVRANLGAVQNRMDYTMRSLDISSENLSDSESRVRNADVAKEMMKFTMSNVLQQAAVSMLSQANQMPNNLLQLLR